MLLSGKILSPPLAVPTTTAHGALTEEIIATALRLNFGHESDASYRLKIIVWFPNACTVEAWGAITWWFKSHVETVQVPDGIVSIGFVKKDHFQNRDGMAWLMAKHGCKLLEVHPDE